MAVVMGIYDELILSFDRLFRGRIKALVLLVLVFGGAIVGIMGFAEVMLVLLSKYPQPTYFLIIGLILGSFRVIYGMHRHMGLSLTRLLMLVLGFLAVAVFSVVHEPVIVLGATVSLELLGYMLLSGFIAGGVMLVPGVSGSAMLVVMGSYMIILQAIRTIEVSRSLLIISAVVVGALMGFVVIAKLMAWLIRRVPGHTYYAIMGLLLGSILVIWPGAAFDSMTGVSVFAALLGYTLVHGFDIISK